MSKIKRRNYTFSITRDFDRICEIVEDYGCYAWIYHDKDTDTTPHWHFYIEFPNPRSISSVADELDIEEHMLEACRNKMAILSYLTHNTEKAKRDGKHIYTFEEIHTNMPEDAFIREERPDPLKTYELYMDLRAGKITPQDFVEAYRSYILTQTLNAQVSMFARLHEAYMADINKNSEPWACHGSEFRVPPN